MNEKKLVSEFYKENPKLMWPNYLSIENLWLIVELGTGDILNTVLTIDE
jgi:hypothetical protein